MRLLQLDPHGKLTLTKDVAIPPRPYAILSHTWGEGDDEITLDDMEKKTGINKPGYAKLQFCANQVENYGLQYFWIDTCCINKQSSAELSEAINSMYAWYEDAAICYVYPGRRGKIGQKEIVLRGQMVHTGLDPAGSTRSKEDHLLRSSLAASGQ
jgi:hypothetical protein